MPTITVNSLWLTPSQYSYKLTLPDGSYVWVPNCRVKYDNKCEIETSFNHIYTVKRTVYDRFGTGHDIEVKRINGQSLCASFDGSESYKNPPSEAPLELPVVTGEPLEELKDE